jgi:hypothetical protein
VTAALPHNLHLTDTSLSPEDVFFSAATTVVRLNAELVELKAELVELKAELVELKAELVELKAELVELVKVPPPLFSTAAVAEVVAALAAAENAEAPKRGRLFSRSPPVAAAFTVAEVGGANPAGRATIV